MAENAVLILFSFVHWGQNFIILTDKNLDISKQLFLRYVNNNDSVFSFKLSLLTEEEAKNLLLILLS